LSSANRSDIAVGGYQRRKQRLPVISTELFKKAFTTAPQTISPSIISLCREVYPDHAPTWVPVHPDRDAIMNECFNNVSAKVTREGGAILYGWLIWEWSRVFIEAEHHAVWEKDGTILDITPHLNGEQKVLFLADPGRVYDYQGKKRIVNVKRGLGQFPSVDRWIKAADNLQHTLEEHSVGDEIRINRAQLSTLVTNLRNAQGAMLVEIAANTKVNDRCFCNSGKFKKCCAPLIDLRSDAGAARVHR
jgi:hypothetical protein